MLEPFATTSRQIDFDLAITTGPVHPEIDQQLKLVWRGLLTDGPELSYYAAPNRRAILLADLARLDVDLTAARAELVVSAGHEATIAHCLYVPMLSELLSHARKPAVHAAALADSAGRAILLAGASGRGKTTACLSLARSGMTILSDDTCFIQAGGPDQRVKIWGVRRPCRVRDKTFTLLPWLADLPHRKAPCGNVNLVDLEAIWPPSAMIGDAAAVFLLQPPNPTAHHAQRADKIFACQELIRQNVHAIEPLANASGGWAMRTITQLVGQADIWRLSVGPDLASLHAFLCDLLAGAGASK